MLETTIRRYTDRRAAGRELAVRLSSLAIENPVVLGLARGGMPVAFEVAQALQAPLDVLVVRKIGAPGNPELGIGAIAEGDVRVLNQELVARTTRRCGGTRGGDRARPRRGRGARQALPRGPAAARGEGADRDRRRRRVGDRWYGPRGAYGRCGRAGREG